ncbi:hypothetical protein MHTCC0001_13350 [Flavobacteriaceae bacterium MHTCC 0001]
MLKFLNSKKVILNLLLLYAFAMQSQNWSQIGSAITGAADNDQSGTAVSLNADGNTVAIGSPFNDDGGNASGEVRVFENIANTWQQKGNDITGIAASDRFGFSVSISADGNVVAIGAPDNNDNSFESGHVRIFQFQTNTWVQIGSTIVGDALSDHSGFSVSLSDDGTRVAIGAPDNGLVANVGSNYGQVRVFENQSGNWVQLGGDIIGDVPEDNLGYAVSLNEDGSIVAVGSREHNSAAGHVKVFQYQTNAWVQLGSDIEGTDSDDKFGGAISLNNSGSIVAVGAEDHDGTGQVRVFENQSNTWVQLGSDIDGEAVEDKFGISVSLNADGTKLAVGGERNGGFTTEAGHVRVYAYENSNWVQIGNDIDGEAVQDRFGTSVSLSADGSLVAAGAYLNDNNGSNSGYVRVLSNSNTLSTIDSYSTAQLKIFPNPTKDHIHIKFQNKIKHASIALYHVNGALLHFQNHTKSTNATTVNISSLPKGMYLLKVQLDNAERMHKIIKQ